MFSRAYRESFAVLSTKSSGTLEQHRGQRIIPPAAGGLVTVAETSALGPDWLVSSARDRPERI